MSERSEEEWSGPREEPTWAASERAASERARYAQGPPISQPVAEPWWELPPAADADADAAPAPAPAPVVPEQRRETPDRQLTPREPAKPRVEPKPVEPFPPPPRDVAPPPVPPRDAGRARDGGAVGSDREANGLSHLSARHTPPKDAPTATGRVTVPPAAAPPVPAPRTPTPDPAAQPVSTVASTASTAVDEPRRVSGPTPAETSPEARDETEKSTGPTRRFVDTAAITLIVTELLIRTWAAWGGYFSLDDFTFARLAAEKGLGTDLLFTPYNSHFMPGAYLMVWAETTIAPLDYRLAAGVDLGLMAISYVLTWLLIRRLGGPRLAALIPLAIALFSPITLPATLWWAVSINQLAMLIAIPGALLAQLAYMRTGKARYGAIAVATAALALPFYEKAALVVPLVFVFTIILQPQSDLPDRFKSALVRFKGQWLAFLILGLVYAGIYVSRPLDERPESAVDLGGLLGNAATNSVPAGLLGGPWSWKAIGAVDASANAPVALRVVSVAIILVTIAITVYRRPLAWQAWTLLGGTLLFDVLVLAVGRLQLGSGAAMEYRYFTDLVPISAVALTLALLGPPAWAATWSQRTGVEWPPVVGGTRLALSNPNALVLPLVVALFVSSLVSTVKYSNRWHDNPAKDYVANAQKSIQAMGRPVDLYNGAVPEKVAWGVLNPTNFPSRLMAPLDLPINADPEISDDLYVLDPSGQLSHARVTSARAPAGTVKNCGYRVAGKRVPIFLDKALFNWWWYAELQYTAKETVTVGFNSANTRGKKVTFQKGEHTVWVKVKGEAAWITIDNVPKSAGLCISSAAVGVAEPGTPATP